jgi:hypothetical protein
MTFLKEAFIKYRALNSPIEVNIASGAYILAIIKGIIRLIVALGGLVYTIALYGVLHVPKLIGSLILVL